MLPAVGGSPREPPQGQVIALDGKTLRHSFDRAGGRGALHGVSAWAAENRGVLGQIAGDEKSNEITALPQWWAPLDVQGGIVTIEAMGCQKEIARQITEQGGDSVLARKGNQRCLFEEVFLFLDDGEARGFRGIVHPTHRTFDGEHGRQETRHYWITGDVQWLLARHGAETWAKLTSIGMVESRRRHGGPGAPETLERRYTISSLPAESATDSERFAQAVRGHWGIENQVHWVLDVAFREDDRRVRTDHAPVTLATLRHLALNLLHQERTAKVGVKGKRLRAGWDDRYLEKLLTI